MPENGPMYTVLFGGWYQRTTLHLTEIYDFLAFGRAQTELDQEKLKRLREQLELAEVKREAGYLEYVRAVTRDGIIIRYYEDGLYVMEVTGPDIAEIQSRLENYFKKLFEPSIAYIFSLGAPLPKILANIQTTHPVVVSVVTTKPTALEIDVAKFGQVYSKLTAKDVTVYKTPGFIFVASSAKAGVAVKELMEMQIFFREFKDQLGKYLSIHRRVWEEIGDIKERREVKGEEIGPLRARLDSYQKTINLINNRINQMGTYIHTRASLARDLEVEQHLKTLFEYKFEVLANTLAYIKEIWAMTREYLSSAIGILKELETQATTNSIKSLQIITSIGVVASILTYLARNEWPKITLTGLVFFILLGGATWGLNLLIGYFYRNLRYRLKFGDQMSNI